MALVASVAVARGGAPLLGGDEIAKIFEKLPQQIHVVASPDTTNWQCTDIDLGEHCSDLDGCAVNLHMQHRIDGNDLVRGIRQHLYFENAATSLSRARGLNGYTRQAGGGEHGWVTGSTALHTLFNPWGWSAGYNYRPAFCPGQSGRNSASHTNPFLITIASHPHVSTVVIIED